MFSGSLRFNLDPFNKVPDNEIIDLLMKANLMNVLNGDEKGLDQEIQEGGANLSSGEK